MTKPFIHCAKFHSSGCLISWLPKTDLCETTECCPPLKTESISCEHQIFLNPEIRLKPSPVNIKFVYWCLPDFPFWCFPDFDVHQRILYLSVTFEKILNDIKIKEKHKTRKNQQTFYKCNMCNNTIKITLYCITTIKAAKGIKNIINAVDGQGLANNYERQIQGQTKLRSTFVMLK